MDGGRQTAHQSQPSRVGVIKNVTRVASWRGAARGEAGEGGWQGGLQEAEVFSFVTHEQGCGVNKSSAVDITPEGFTIHGCRCGVGLRAYVCCVIYQV